MSAIDIAIALAGLVFVALLIRAANTLSENPHQQIRAHEEMAGRQFPSDITQADKQRLINLRGLSPTNPKRIWGLLALVAAVLAILIWQR